MKSRAWVLLLALTGCAGQAQPQAYEPPQRWTGPEGGSDSPTPWHRDVRTNLAIRIRGDGPHALGRPIRVVVEAKNFNSRPVCFDTQSLLHVPYQLLCPDGRPAYPIASTAYRGQSWQRIVTLAPDAVMELDHVDLDHSFGIFEPGPYTVQFAGLYKWGMWFEQDVVPDEAPPGSVLSGIPESAPLRIEIQDGPGSTRNQILKRVIPILPAEWVLYWNSGEKGSSITMYRRDLDAVGRGATVPLGWGVPSPPGSSALGTSAWGSVWLGPVVVSRMSPRDDEDLRLENELTRTVLSDLRRRIKEALALR